ncbi:M20/M25/M40 family metallo-hydrolase [Christiangramia sabulilitoris]|uniref:M20/M25/M40 family metallo-hydrolase n=1 Tax=Christiangramia sabulilitoris TaxID=2583991 RepID=UPI00140A2578|nr:M20/M25/M40 family metallo-hydrolase [Christiangramia sabulilitoris]
MNLLKYSIILTGLFYFNSCQSQNAGNIKIDEVYLIENLKIISHDSLEGRFFGTTANYKAQQFIAARFDSLGISPLLDSGFIQSFPVTFKGEKRLEVYPYKNTGSNYSKVTDTTVTGGNVIAILPGKIEKHIIVTAHLDHLGIKNGQVFNGADDNASGTAALLSIASYFKEKPTRHNLIFAAVDAEEIGSYGAEYLLENFPADPGSIVLNINMDMIAHNDEMQLYASGLYHYPDLKPALKNLPAGKIELKFGHDQPGKSGEEDWTYSSDHRIFHKRQIPFIYFGVEDHKDYHQPSDEFENINQQFYIEAVKLIIQAIENYDSSLSEKI